ncbi:protein of unknown function [Flavobacterium resistens]|uniref:DUF4062 domain-containing protein n=1 Tax=Flavobacterium resistens TaxID=443612 RepID=A0A521CT26_9FLAO|nr:DUF4062 domain-containing protein [Flavobacterium resistens]MRX66932.1 DUF4062 domain-containing protein [Flavobacterium resistens]SMO62538.1 protein of unknown function [Flavobacterium resistens]
MIPRVFISSTYYDLKHVRERLEKFIENYGFEPVLFESDKITYQHGSPIDQSAYYEVGLCHIMILIIGGRYGSPVNSSNIEEERKKYDDEFISITRREFETSIANNIPVLIFIDKNVNSDYETYKENQDFFDDLYAKQKTENKKFKFAHVDHINIFKFLDIVKTKPIKTFDKVEQIENYLKNQFSGLFYLYLEGLKKQSSDTKILDTISELNNISLRMNEMLTSVGKQILGNDKEEYEKVIKKQFEIMLDFYTEKFSSSISFVNTLSSEELKEIDLFKILMVIYNEALLLEIPRLKNWTKYEEWADYNKNIDQQILNKVQSDISTVDPRIILKRFDYRKLNQELKQKVLPFIKDELDQQELFKRLINALTSELDELPF